jgi:hypothetical protein
MILRRDECGLADWRNGYPAAYWKGLFLLFLQDAPEHGLDAILRLVNYATSLTMPARVKNFFVFFIPPFLFSSTQLRSLRRVVLVVPLNSASTTTARS